ncbi:hypothetical protein V3C99_014896 [Haemonchus contortus]|uniref:PH domain-containing protein n=1 Tax=Haemonchus contortus TaxID=6289 RepID=A0A7I5ECD3_HAECO|nr:Protein C47E8.1 [Haemonchus contortus]
MDVSSERDFSSTSSVPPKFGCTSNFLGSITVVATMGVAVLFVDSIARISTAVCGFVAFPLGVLIHHWYWLHGGKLTRRERIFFDEANLLETSGLFEYSRPPNTEGTTPFSGPEKNPDAPTNLWQALFCDDKEIQIQKFYKEHYGPVWETAKRREQEWKAIESSVNGVNGKPNSSKTENSSQK